MLGCFRAMGLSLAVAAMVMGLVAAPTQAQAQSGAVHVRVVKAGFIVGMGGGDGTLTYRGRVYPFSVGGIGLGTFGAAVANLRGRAYNLRSPAAFAGTYTAIGASAAIGAGVKVARLQNANGVILELQGGEIGLEVSLNLSGMTVTMR
jgi:hypothetical protein